MYLQMMEETARTHTGIVALPATAHLIRSAWGLESASMEFAGPHPLLEEELVNTATMQV